MSFLRARVRSNGWSDLCTAPLPMKWLLRMDSESEVNPFLVKPRRLTCRKKSESGNREKGTTQASTSPACGSLGKAACCHVHVPPSGSNGRSLAKYVST